MAASASPSPLLSPSLPSSSSLSSSPSVRPLTGYEDLILFYSLTKSYKKYVALPIPSTFEHLIAHLPGPSLYTTAPPSLSPSTTSPLLIPITSKDTLLMPLSYHSMPLPLQVRPISAELAQGVLAMREVGELGLVQAELKGKEERRQRWTAERRAAKEEKVKKKSDKKRKQSGTTNHPLEQHKKVQRSHTPTRPHTQTLHHHHAHLSTVHCLTLLPSCACVTVLWRMCCDVQLRTDTSAMIDIG